MRGDALDKKRNSGRAIVRQLFLDNLGKVITKEELIRAICEGTGLPDYENWHQRLSELRTDEGYTILSRRDRRDLRPGQYLMLSSERREAAAKRVRPTPSTWRAVLTRAQSRCEWQEEGVRCGLMDGATDTVGGGTVKLTPDHMRPHSVDPRSHADDPAQWQALCGRHQVTKRNYWDSTTGKLNVVAIVQAASGKDKAVVFRMLLAYFGYTVDANGNVGKV
jgi:hypothetical protein